MITKYDRQKNLIYKIYTLQRPSSAARMCSLKVCGWLHLLPSAKRAPHPWCTSGQNTHKRYELTVSQTSQIVFKCAWEDYFSLLAPARKKESKSDQFWVLGSTGELPAAPKLQPSQSRALPPFASIVPVLLQERLESMPQHRRSTR